MEGDIADDPAAFGDFVTEIEATEEEIDTDDIPEAPAENWAFARRPGLYRPVKKPVTLRLDVDLVEWFKSHAPDGGYQTEINRVLRRYVAEAGR